MKSLVGNTPKTTFLDISTAANLAGFSQRHFRRIIEGAEIRTIEIGRKFFITTADFERWRDANQSCPPAPQEYREKRAY